MGNTRKRNTRPTPKPSTNGKAPAETEPRVVSRRAYVRVQVGDTVDLTIDRPCGHSNALSLGMGGDLAVTFGYTVVADGIHTRIIEDCKTCRDQAARRVKAAEAGIVEPEVADA